MSEGSTQYTHVSQNSIGNSLGLSARTRKILKKKQKNQSTPLPDKLGNYKVGRPSIPYNGNACQFDKINEHKLTTNFWFGNDLASYLLIYFSIQGSLTVKFKTGKPAQEGKKAQLEQLTAYDTKRIKQFKRIYKKQLINKIKQLLKQSGYPSNGTYLILKNNKEVNSEIDCEGLEDMYNKAGVNLLLANLDPQFIKTYELIVMNYFYHRYSYDKQQIASMIVDKISAAPNKSDHKMLFDLQTIKFYVDNDFRQLDVDMEDPIAAQQYAKLNQKVNTIDLEDSRVKNDIESIQADNKWIYQFIEGMLDVLDKYSSKQQ